MKCINEDCELRAICEEVHTLNGLKINEDTKIIIPDIFFLELNMNNRLAKRGIPEEGFELGCFKILRKNNDDELGEFYINDKYMIDYDLNQLIEISNDAFKEMVTNGRVKIR